MGLPFTVDEFFQLFEDYNLAIWPVPVVAYVFGVAAVLYAARGTQYSDSIVCTVLGLFWLWMGVVYHIGFFAAINKVAYAFGALYVIQGALFLVIGAFRGRLSFGFQPNAFCAAGALFILYAMVVYPLLNILLGHAYPRSPGFGVAPCPTTIFTFGLLLWTNSQVPKHILVVPALWSLIGFSAVVKLGVLEDTGVLLAGVVGTAMLLYRDRSRAAVVRPDIHDV